MAFIAGAVEATLELDRSPFIRSLAAARRDAANFARKTYEATLDLDGAAKTVAEIKGVDTAADRLDGRDIDIDVDKDGSASAGIGSISGGFKSLASNIRATGTVLTASAIPFGIAAIGAATPALLAVGASAAGLALNLGRAAAGFGLVAAAAGGGALVGLKAYAALLSSVVRDTREAWTATHEHAAELLEQRRQHILGTAAANKFNEELNRQIIGLTKLEAAVGREVFPIFTREMRAWGGILRANQGAIVDTATSIANVAAGFSEWFRTTDDGRVFGRTLEFINSSAVKGAQALALVGRTGLSALQPLIPLASRFQDAILGIVRTTDRWVESAEGQNRLGQIYRALWSDTRRLWEITKDLGVAVFNVFDALDRTGVADQATRGFAALASALRSATRAGGGLDGFLRDTRQLMPFVGGAALKLVGAIGDIASAAIKARQEGHRLTVLQEIFRGISRAAKPLRQLVVGAFEDLGPEIAKLIPRLANFFRIFAGSSGPLVTFVRTINRALQIFNNLPGPVKRTAANLAALKLILGGLGVGSLVGGMGRFASNAFLANRATRRLSSGAAMGGMAARFAGLGSVLVAGGVIAAIAAVAGAFYLAYKNNKKFREGVNDTVRRLQAFGKNTFDRARAAFRDIFDIDTRQVVKNAKKSGDATAIAYATTQKNRMKKMLGEGQWQRELGFKIGQLIGKGLNAFAESGNANAPRGIGEKIRKMMRTGANPVEFGRNLQKDIAQGVGSEDVRWKRVGKKLIDFLKSGITNREVIDSINNWIAKHITQGLLDHGWYRLGEQLMDRMTFGITGFLRTKGKERLQKASGITADVIANKEGFKKSGKESAWGWVLGFNSVGISQSIAGKIAGVLDNLRRDNDGNSPWGSTMKLGRDAAEGFRLGWLEGFSKSRINEMADKAAGPLKSRIWGKVGKGKLFGDMGDPRDAVDDLLGKKNLSRRELRYVIQASNNVLSDNFRFLHDNAYKRHAREFKRAGYGMFEDFTFLRNQQMRRYQGGPSGGGGGTHRGGWQHARGGGGSGGGMTSGEHRANLKGHTRELADLMIAAIGDAPNLRTFKARLDASMGGYLGFRNGMGTEPQ